MANSLRQFLDIFCLTILAINRSLWTGVEMGIELIFDLYGEMWGTF